MPSFPAAMVRGWNPKEPAMWAHSGFSTSAQTGPKKVQAVRGVPRGLQGTSRNVSSGWVRTLEVNPMTVGK